CNLRCQFCQNFDISHLGHGEEARPERLAKMMLELQAMGCHNINFVTPEHVVPQILEAFLLAIEGGLRLPIVYNTSAYDSMESLRQKDYPEAARRAIKEMHRQVGELKMDENGLAKRGVLVRHLVMPGAVAGTREIMKFLAREVSPHTYINVMRQYYPAGKVSREKFPEINRGITTQE
ncbi:MAG: radical SAM protein, partial [Anaerolineae bacterium]|nr:radical SAM protein [Anaerolineae bacterium]